MWSVKHAVPHSQACFRSLSVPSGEVLKNFVVCAIRINLNNVPLFVTTRIGGTKKVTPGQGKLVGVGSIAPGEVLECGVTTSVCVKPEHRSQLELPPETVVP